MKRYLSIVFFALFVCTSYARVDYIRMPRTGQIIYTTNINLNIVGDSMSANSGQPCWWIDFTNQVGPFHLIINGAHNGAYLDSSGSMMDFYITEILPFFDPAYTNIIISFIGANNDMPNFNDYLDFQTDYIFYDSRAISDGYIVGNWTIAINWRITNSLPYWTNWSKANSTIRTNPLNTFLNDDAAQFPTNYVVTGTVLGDVPPLHYDLLSSKINATNQFYSMTTNSGSILTVSNLTIGTLTIGP